ncbi:argininosuccinate synthase [Candidatus Woesearchaeota archaeon]|nr:argininosuccinate synthase [Candidatus Woesearchaeota archaeon]
MGKGIVLAYTGGLDATVALHWLAHKGHEVIAFTADIGQRLDFGQLRQFALEAGAAEYVATDCKEQFVRQYIFPAQRANARYYEYLLGGALPKALVALAQVRVANERGITIVAHGATRNQNEFYRFQKAYRHSGRGVEVYVPWEDKDFINEFPDRKTLLAYTQAHEIRSTTTEMRPWTSEKHLFHECYEDYPEPLTQKLLRRMITVTHPADAPGIPLEACIRFENGNPVLFATSGREHDGIAREPVELMERLFDAGAAYGIGIAELQIPDIDGVTREGLYVTPGGAILYEAHRKLSQKLIGGEYARFSSLSSQFGRLAFYGDWFNSEMAETMSQVDELQKNVKGKVNLLLSGGTVTITSVVV